MITMPVFIALLTLAYGTFLWGIFGKTNNTSKIIALVLSTFLLFTTGALSVDVNNAIIGLINIPLAVICGGIAVGRMGEELGESW